MFAAAQTRVPRYSGLVASPSIPAARQPAAAAPRSALRSGLVVEAKVLTRHDLREKRHYRVRSKVNGTPERPRLAVFRSNSHIYAQVIDDSVGNTLAAVSSLTPEIREKTGGNGGNEEAAKLVGLRIAELCKAKNIEKVCFDRGGFRFHGRVQALADAAREGGLNF